jgi:hypothetical protein
MNTFQLRLLQLLVKPIGNLLMGIITAAIAAVVASLAKANPDIAAKIDVNACASVVWGVAMWWINGWINKKLTANVSTLQQGLNDRGAKLEVDGYLGDQTATALERLSGLPVRRATPYLP